MNLAEEIEKAKGHYRDRNFKRALEEFEKILDVDREQWECQLYLAMCSYKLGQLNSSMQRFRMITERCPVKDIRDKAEVAMVPIKKEALSMTMSDLKKLDLSKLDPLNLPIKPAAVQSASEQAKVEWLPKEVKDYT